MSTKAVMIVAADAQGTATRPVPEGRRKQAALSDEALAELGALGMRVEQHFDGVPQDIEWAIADGRCWLLQARPITNLPPAPLWDVRWEPLRPGTIWMRRQVVEHMPEPLSPLFDELYLQQGLDRSMEEMAVFLSDLSGVEINLWDFIDPPFAATINGYAYSTASFKFSWQLVPTALRIYTAVLPRMLRHLVPRWRDESLPGYQALAARWKALDLASASDRDLLQGMRELARADAIYWFAAAIPLGLARVADVALDRFLKLVLGGQDSVAGSSVNSGSFLRGFPSKAMSAQMELEAIARTINGSEELRQLVVNTPAPNLLQGLAQLPTGKSVLHDLGQYLDEYGHQIYNLDFAAPTLADDPLPVLLSLKAAVAHPERDARARQTRMVQERETLVAGTEQSLNPFQRRLFRLLLGWAQRYAPIREEALFYVGAGWPALRRLALELGRRLTGTGSLNTPDDVFYLKTAELTAASAARAGGTSRPDLARLAQERRELRSARRRLEPPAVVPPGGRLKFGPIDMALFEPRPRHVAAGPTLSGFAVSPGRVTAPASVVRSPEDFDKMMPDTVLVCPTTTPAWTPLFAQASGLVTDIGGALAHGSIVAREYGIPAVMGTGVATQRIESGQRLLVDGDTGTVTLADEGESADRIAQAQVIAQERAATARKRKAFIALAVGAFVAAVAWHRKRRGRPHH